jgi:hypothetical protein
MVQMQRLAQVGVGEGLHPDGIGQTTFASVVEEALGPDSLPIEDEGQ